MKQIKINTLSAVVQLLIREGRTCSHWGWLEAMHIQW